MANSSAASPGPLSALPPELHALLEGPSIMYLATRNAALEPLSALAFGLQAASDGRELTVFLPAVLSAPTLANLRDNGQMAMRAGVRASRFRRPMSVRSSEDACASSWFRPSWNRLFRARHNS